MIGTEMIGQMPVWSSIDTWIILTSSLVAAASAIPGCFLFLRKQSMIADALTHAALPGVVVAFILAGYFQTFGVFAGDGSWAFRQSMMFGGAMVAGLLTAYLTEWVAASGWIRGDAAMGVVFTTLFAIGLILLRQFADKSDVDLECVLYGQLDTIGLARGIPPEAITCALILVVNIVLVIVLFKELLLTTFDPQLAGTLGLRPKWMHYGLMTVTTATIVTAFEVVGSILAIGMLVIPPSTAFFISRRLRPMILVSMGAGVSACVLGHLAAISLPGPITRSLGLPQVESVTTAGAIVITATLQMLVAMLIGPERGILVDRFRAAGPTARQETA
ncbi:MAG: metal ABC transporter permease [Rubripirellula sp.]